MIDFSNVAIKVEGEGYLQDTYSQEYRQGEMRLESEVFLTDFFMMATGNLFPAERKKELKQVSGIYNYAQGITHRLMTTRGEHPMDFALGIPWDRYLGKVIYDQELAELELGAEITSEVMRDPRTLEVAYLSVTFTDINVIQVTLVVTPIGLNKEALIEFTAERRGD